MSAATLDLGTASRILREALKDKSYRSTPLHRENVRRALAKLTAEQTVEIKTEADRLSAEARARGRTNRRFGWIGEMAARYDVSRATIKKAAL